MAKKMIKKEYAITPVPKPRMTQRDKWAKRPAVVRYFNFCDEVRALGCELPEHSAHVIFHMPMPKSWSKKKKAKMNGKPHQQRPDWDNLIKALQDAVMKEDSSVWNCQVSKFWAINGNISVITPCNKS